MNRRLFQYLGHRVYDDVFIPYFQKRPLHSPPRFNEVGYRRIFTCNQKPVCGGSYLFLNLVNILISEAFPHHIPK